MEASDWITSFLDLTEGLPTPPAFRLWSAIFAIGAALERRCWIHINAQVAYPNNFILLVGGPATGKGVSLNPVRELLARSKAALLAPDDMTKAALVDTLKESRRRDILAKGAPPTESHPLCVMPAEFGTLVNAHDLEFFSTLSDLWDCRASYGSRRRGHNEGKAIAIVNPALNILSGVPPAFLGNLLPEAAWHQGFTARMMMVYQDASHVPQIDIFARRAQKPELEELLARRLASLGKLTGEFLPDEPALRAMRLWYASGLKPIPDHPKLAPYAGRRLHHLGKLCIIASASRGESREITEADFIRARSWLLSAEALAPNIFRDMSLKSDGVVMEECWRYCMDLWVRSGRSPESRKPVHQEQVMTFLALRCDHGRSLQVLETLVLAGWLNRIESTLYYLPRAKGFTKSED